MDLQKWEAVIIEWVNCLNLSHNIINFIDLRDSEFFFNLIKLLKQDVRITDTTIDDLKIFIREQYPNCIFENVECTKLNQFTTNDLIVLSSLLLHYSCIIDKREVLISPLCNTLSETSQVCVRAFLEHVTDQITTTELFNIICICINDAPKSKSVRFYALQSGDSHLTNSPLQAFLNTPPQSSRFLNKDKKITKLLHEIDSERFDKYELQDKLDDQKKQNLKLRAQMDEKNSQIVKLRAEIYDLENNLLPQENQESLELQQRLRTEIKNLEEYIKQLENEQEELYNERDRSKNALKEAEAECALWHNKAVTVEQNLENIIEKYQQQDVDLGHYKVKCMELNAILKELTPKSTDDLEMDSSMINSCSKTFNDSSCGEAACSVIDIQLKEAQNENAELKSLLKQSQNNSNILNSELSTLRNRLEKVNENYNLLQENNSELFKKVSVLEETQHDLHCTQHELEECRMEIAKFIDKNITNKHILKLEQDFNNGQQSINSLQLSNEALNLDLQNIKEECTDFGNTVKENVKSHCLLEQFSIVQLEYNRLLENYQNSNFNLHSKSLAFNQLDSAMEQCLQKLNKLIHNNNTIDITNKYTAFSQMITDLEQQELNNLSEKNIMIENLADFEILTKKLEREINDLNDKEVISLQERAVLSESLDFANNTIEVLENTISDHVNKINNLEKTVSEMTETISHLKAVEKAVEQKQDVIDVLEVNNMNLESQLQESLSELARNKALQEKLETTLENYQQMNLNCKNKILDVKNLLQVSEDVKKVLLEEVDDLKSQNDLFEKQILKLTTQVQKEKDNCEELRLVISQLETDKCTVEQELIDAKNSIIDHQDKRNLLEHNMFEQKKLNEEHINSLNVQIEKYSSRVNGLENELQDVIIQYDNTQKKLQEVTLVKQNLEEHLETCKDDYNKRLSVLNSTISQLENNLKITKENETDLKNQLDAKLLGYENLKSEMTERACRYDELVEELNVTQEKVITLEEECDEKDNVISIKNQNLLMVKLELEQKKVENRTLTDDLIREQLKIRNMEQHIGSLNKEIELSKNTIEELQREQIILHNLNATLQKKCDDFESNTLKIISELSIKNEEFDAAALKLKEHQEVTEITISNLKSTLSETEAKVEDLMNKENSVVLEHKLKIKDLQEERCNLNEKIEFLNKSELENLDKIRLTQEELSDTIKKYTESLQMHQEFKTETETQVHNLTVSLHEITEKYNVTDKIYSETKSELESIKNKLEILQNEKIQFEILMLQQKAEYEANYNQCKAQFNLQITELTNKENLLNSDLNILKEELKNSKNNHENLSDLFKEVSEELSLLHQEKDTMRKTVEHLYKTHKELNEMCNCLKDNHLRFTEDISENLKKVQVELVDYIINLTNENETLKHTIKELKESINVYQIEKDTINSEFNLKLQQSENNIEAMEEEKTVYKINIEKLLEEKATLEDHIIDERNKLNRCKERLDEEIKANSVQVEDYKETIAKLKCALDILETGKLNLEEKVESLMKNIDESERAKTTISESLVKEINVKDTIISNLNNKIDLLESQLSENVNNCDELKLELCTVNELLKSLTEKHLKMEKVFRDEKLGYTEKLQTFETDFKSKEILFENLKSENHSLQEQITVTKSEVNNLQQKLASTLLERDTLQLERETINEKLLAQESQCRVQESTIAEINSKLLWKLSELLDVQNEKRILQERLETITHELNLVKKSRDEIIESQIKIFEETESKVIRAHEQGIEMKNDLLKRIEELELEKQVQVDVEELLKIEKVAKEILEIRVLELTNEKSKFIQLCSNLKHKVERLAKALNQKVVSVDSEELSFDNFESLNVTLETLQERIVTVIDEHKTCVTEISTLKNEKIEITKKIEMIEAEKQLIDEEREQLLQKYNIIRKEKLKIEQEVVDSTTQNENYNQLHEKIMQLEQKLMEGYEIYKKFASLSNNYNSEVEQLISERTIVEEILNNLKFNLSAIKVKHLYVYDAREQKRIIEQIESFETIIEDIQKQFLRLSRKINNIISIVIQIPVDIYNSINSENSNVVNDIVSKFNFNDELEKVTDCKDRAKNLLQEMVTYTDILDKKISKTQKENVLQSINTIKTEIKDDELRKRNLALKQKLTLAENAKSNLEKKIKQLRENKSSNSKCETFDEDLAYKKLLREHIQTKEEYEKRLTSYKANYEKLLKEYEEYKNAHVSNKLQHQKDVKTEQDVKLETEVVKLRDAYGNLMSDNSKLELENSTLRNLLEERTSQLSQTKLIKEAYERIIEENNKLRLEVDTVKYKRNRDREAFADTFKKDQDESKRKIEEVRNEYETKLEKIKDEMVQVYRKEVNNKMQKDITEKAYYQNTIEQLQQSLQLEKSRHLNLASFESQGCDFCSCREAVVPASTSMPAPKVPVKAPEKFVIDWKSQKSRKCSTLPTSSTVNPVKLNSISKKSTMQPRLEMEDEEDDGFNNKYLTDLKEGRCVVPSGRESSMSISSNSNRFSELKWRNSMCPPHLKSSYPAETQFNSPKQFKEEDIKSGIVDLDDSMSTRLLPGEKPRKKDAGTTSYKKPGPPTPSKNGGRMSLQGNEVCVRDILREPNDSKTPKRNTPSRLKALFRGRNSSNIRENSENQSGTPKSKRLSIFRKQK